MPHGIDPKIDFAFKWVFGREQNAPLLVLLLNALLDPPADRRLVSLTILNPLLPQESDEDKLSVLDVRARDGQGRHYNIEMQLFTHPHLKERLLYYWAKMYGQQLSEGEPYSSLQPAISVLLLDDKLPLDGGDSEEASHLQRYRLWNDSHSAVFSDQLSLHVVEFPRFRKQLSELKTELDGWLFVLQHGAELETKLWPEELQYSGLYQAVEELEMLATTEAERIRYESRTKGLRDDISRMEGADHRGADKGQIPLLQKYLRLPITTPESLNLMSDSQRKRLLAELEATFLAMTGLTLD